MTVMGALAFEPDFTPEALWRSSEIVRGNPELPEDEADALSEYAGTFAEILLLPTTGDVFPGANDSDLF